MLFSLSFSISTDIDTIFNSRSESIDFYAISEYLQRKIGQITYVRPLYLVILYFILDRNSKAFLLFLRW